MIELKKIAGQILEQTLAGIDIAGTMCRKLPRIGARLKIEDLTIELATFDRIRAIAYGKAAFAMAQGLVEVLAPDFAAEGILVTPGPAPRVVPGFRAFAGGHPVPNEGSFAAGRAILDALASCDARTLIFFLLSGGGSALVEQPLHPAITLADFQALHRVLVTCGAPIDEINSVRKHLSAVKGGRLAAAAPEAMKVTLGVSDVPEGRESALASGPTLPDPSTAEDARRVVHQHGTLPKLPASLRAKFEQPGAIPETPKRDHPAFRRAQFSLLLGLHDLFHQTHRASETAGFVTICDNSTDDWPIAKAADYLLGLLAEHQRANHGRHVAVIADGEVSSPVTGNGTGGRNSAFVLDCVAKIAGKRIAVLSAGTDGIDGASPAAGAVADGETLARARAAGLEPADYFRRSDSYTFFKALGDTIETGPTGNNLRDLRILLAD